jgi:TRAP transporter TAXI family solute receptor
MKTMKHRKHSYKEIFFLLIPVAIIIYFGFWGAYQFVSPAPPKNITISSGNINGAYYAYANKYSEELLKEKIDLKVLESTGSRENINRLLNKEVDIALVQGGTTYADEQLLSLGSLYFEPVSIFYRQDLNAEKLNDFKGLTISIGPDGSGTQMLANQLFAINHVNLQNTKFINLTLDEAASQLKAGKIDAAFFVSSIHAPIIQSLLHSSDLKLFSFERADAYTQVLPFLSKVTLHEGIIDFNKNIPEKPIRLLAPTANLVVRSDLHKSLSLLLLQAIEKHHGQNDLFAAEGFFPSAELTAYPLSDVAKRYLENGPPFLMKYLPFWLASFIDRMVVMLVPLFFVLLPLFKILPPIYRWRIRSRVYRWYKELQEVDDKTVDTSLSEAEFRQLNQELERITREVSRLHTPLSNADQVYNLMVHIDLIRKLLKTKLDNKTDS